MSEALTLILPLEQHEIFPAIFLAKFNVRGSDIDFATRTPGFFSAIFFSIYNVRGSDIDFELKSIAI
jgi:hypothetical protein